VIIEVLSFRLAKLSVTSRMSGFCTKNLTDPEQDKKFKEDRGIR